MKPKPETKPTRADSFERREVIDTIRQTVCKGATDAQLRMFLEVCKRTGLDPFLKEISFVAERGIIMANRDGYLRVANQDPAFDGMETRVERDEWGMPIKAVCTVWRKDRSHPTICEAYYSEYNKQTPVWKQYPSAMIGKVAEVLALKRTFAINGVVTEEEIGHEEPARPAEPPSPFRQMIDQFAELKARLASDEIYYAVLRDFGAAHANELRDLTKARAAYRKLLEKVRESEQARVRAEEAAIVDAAMASEASAEEEQANP
jgi:phage recombination protein Bet